MFCLSVVYTWREDINLQFLWRLNIADSVYHCADILLEGLLQLHLLTLRLQLLIRGKKFGQNSPLKDPSTLRLIRLVTSDGKTTVPWFSGPSLRQIFSHEAEGSYVPIVAISTLDRLLCPFLFRTLRKLFNVDAADYMLSICGNDALRELSSPGKSGSFFYLTNDDKYMIKTMKKAEVKVSFNFVSIMTPF